MSNFQDQCGAAKAPFKTSVERREPSQYVRITNYGEPTAEALEMAVRVAIAAGKAISVDTMGMDLAVHPDSSARDLITIVQLVQEINRLNDRNEQMHQSKMHAVNLMEAAKEKYECVTDDLNKLIEHQEETIAAQKNSLAALEGSVESHKAHASRLEAAAKKDEKRIKVLIDSQNELSGKLLNLEEENKRLASLVEERDSRIRSFEGIISTGKADNERLKGRIGEQNVEIKAIGDEFQKYRDKASGRITALEEANKEMDSVLKSGKMVELEPEERELVGDLLIICAAGLTSNKSGEKLIHVYISDDFAEQLESLKEKAKFD